MIIVLITIEMKRLCAVKAKAIRRDHNYYISYSIKEYGQKQIGSGQKDEPKVPYARKDLFKTILCY